MFRSALFEFFAKGNIDAEGFDACLTKTRLKYKEQANRAMFNLLGSHDTPRFLTLCEEKEEQMRLAIIFQMTYLGIPEIYYVDEIGMVGGNDPDCRRTMVWDEQKQNREMFRLHQKLIAIRKQHSALQTGSYRPIITDPLTNLYGFIREDEGETVLVLLNNSIRKEQTSLPSETSLRSERGSLRRSRSHVS